MTEYPERHRSRMPGWCRRMASFSAVLLAVVWVGHHYGLVETPGYLWVLALVALLAALALLLGAVGFSRIWNHGGPGGRDILAGVLIAALVLAPYAAVAWLIVALPPLRDISTDFEALPALPTATGRTAAMNTLVPPTPGEQRLQVENYPLAVGRRYELPIDETVAAVEAVLASRGWHAVQPAPRAGAAREITIGAVADSLGLDLPADVSIRIGVDGHSTLVDMRSASRYGRHDLGDNARRIAGFLSDLDEQVNNRTGAAAE